jgi:hypothetical protein
MARRTLLPRYSRLPGSSKRVKTPEGSIISDRAYNVIANTSKLDDSAIKSFERALAKNNGDVQFARDASRITNRQFEAYRKHTPAATNPFQKEHGKYLSSGVKTRFHAFIGTNGLPQYEVAFAGDDLTAMRQLREAIERRDQKALDQWKRQHSDGIADRFGRLHNPETSLRKLNAAKRRMSPAERSYFATREHYGTPAVADAA